jgi:glycosyltransferase involved in cell wall biosynthesis
MGVSQRNENERLDLSAVLEALTRSPARRVDPRPTVLDVRVVTEAGGGPDKTILNSPRFVADSYRNLCAYMHPPGDAGFETLRAKAKQWQAPLISVPDRGPFDWRVVSRCLDLCRRERVAIWHGHEYKSNVLGLLIRRFWPMRLVTTVHGWVKHTKRTPLYYAIDRFCLPRYERVVAVSPDLLEASRAAGVPEGRCLLIENGIDTDEYCRAYAPGQSELRADMPAGRLVVGAVGRLSEEKGFDVLIRAADRLLTEGIDFELWIVGTGDQRENLANMVAERKRGDRVRLLGYRADMIDLYHAMDAFALSSLREGLPNVVLEAMALEVPVLATRIAGVPRLVCDGENGLLIAPGDEGQLTAGLRRILTDTEARRRIALAGRQTIEDRYSFRLRMEKMRVVYDELLKSRGSGG